MIAGRRVLGVGEKIIPSDTRHPTPDTPPTADTLFRHEGDFWTLAYQGTVCRVKDAKGLHYIAYLLRHPGREFHVLDLLGQQGLEIRGWSLGEQSHGSKNGDQRTETSLPI